jgi:DNA-binding transcriptional MerR regulator
MLLFKLYFRLFKIRKLSELLNENLENSKEMVSLKNLILDQLSMLTEKFENVSKENIDNYLEMKKKITSIMEEFCTMDFDKKVRM